MKLSCYCGSLLFCHLAPIHLGLASAADPAPLEGSGYILFQSPVAPAGSQRQALSLSAELNELRRLCDSASLCVTGLASQSCG